MEIISKMGGRYLEEAEIESLLEEARVAIFCSHNKDGTIHAIPLWFGYIDGKIIILTPSGSRKVKNVKRNRDVSVLVETRSPPKGALIYGKAEIDYDDPIPTAISITEKFMSKEKVKDFAENAVKNLGLDLLIRIKPERIVAFQY